LVDDSGGEATALLSDMRAAWILEKNDNGKQQARSAAQKRLLRRRHVREQW